MVYLTFAKLPPIFRPLNIPYGVVIGFILEQVKMAGELSYHTTLEVEVEAAVVGVVDALVLIWNAMNVVSLDILLVSAVWGEVLEGVGVVARLLDIVGAQAMVEGKIGVKICGEMRVLHCFVIWSFM